MDKLLESHNESLDERSEAGFLSRRSHVQIVPGALKKPSGGFLWSFDPEKLSHGRSVTVPDLPGENGTVCHIFTRTGERIAVDRNRVAELSRFTWCVDAAGYPLRHLPRSGTKKRKQSLHRFLTSAAAGDVVDHVDGNPFNATSSNLRLTNSLGNARNIVSSKRQKRGQFKGVYFVKKSGRWGATICAGEKKPNGRSKQLHLGCFDTPEQAAKAYDHAAVLAWGEFAATNFPRHEYEAEAAE